MRDQPFEVILLACCCLLGSALGGEAQGRRERTVLYQAKAGASAAQTSALQAVLDKHQFASVRKLVGGKVSQAQAKDKGVREEDLAAEIRATGAVDFAEPDYRVAPVQMPNDPLIGNQWFHTKINSAGAWDITTGSSAVLVAVCDTGVESTHPDLAPNLKLPGFNTVDNSSNSEPIHYHGTMVAGLMGAVGNNGAGVAGMNWNVKILPIRITNDTAGYAYYSDMSEGIRYAADQGAKVVNLSYGGASSSTIDSAAQYMRGKGGLLVMAASNDGVNGDGTYPDFTSFIAVGATDSSDTRASWSNYGTYIDVVAPGVSTYTTYPGGSYTSGSGTSFASPITAGLLGLIFSINPSFSPAQAESFLFSTCVDLGDPGEDIVYGHGRINAAAAVQKAKNYTGNTAPHLISSPWANPNPVTLPGTTTVAVDAADSDNGPSPLTYTWSKLSGPGTVSFSPNGTTGSNYSTPTFSTSGSYVLRVTVSDGSASVTGDVSVTVNANPNAVVYVTSIGMGVTPSKSGTKANARVYVVSTGGVPAAGATVTGSWSGVAPGSSSGTTGADGSVTLSSPKTRKSGTFTFTVTGITKSGYSYAPGSNLVTSASIGTAGAAGAEE